MKREIVINANPRETRVAIIEDDQLVELLVDRPEARRMVGDIYIGKVEAVLPGIQAAFVDIGTEKSAFLHASDLVQDDEDDDDDEDEDGEDENDADVEVARAETTDADAGDSPYADATEPAGAHPSRRGRGNGGGRRTASRRPGGNSGSGNGDNGRGKHPPIQDLVSRGQDILVQISKEPISTKGPRVTAQISLAGRFLVYMPDATRVGVSRKIGDRAERQRLREMVQAVLPEKSGGVIIRTVGEDATQETFKRELLALIATWKRVKRKTHFVRAPSLVHRETSLTRGIIRDLFSDKIDALTVDSKVVYSEIVEYLKGIAPDLIDRVKLYEEAVPLFDKANIETEIRDLFKRRCDLPSGGYLIIEPTEALVSIDVNSGRYTGKKDPEKTILKTNLEAAREVARQLRLRDVGGIIVCDFIDMETKANRERVLQELRTNLARDRARTKALTLPPHNISSDGFTLVQLHQTEGPTPGKPTGKYYYTSLASIGQDKVGPEGILPSNAGIVQSAPGTPSSLISGEWSWTDTSEADAVFSNPAKQVSISNNVFYGGIFLGIAGGGALAIISEISSVIEKAKKRKKERESERDRSEPEPNNAPENTVTDFAEKSVPANSPAGQPVQVRSAESPREPEPSSSPVAVPEHERSILNPRNSFWALLGTASGIAAGWALTRKLEKRGLRHLLIVEVPELTQTRTDRRHKAGGYVGLSLAGPGHIEGTWHREHAINNENQ